MRSSMADLRKYLSLEDLEWSEPTNNDLPPTEPQPGDYTYWEMDYDEALERHVALMGGWCAHHPDRSKDGVIVGEYHG